MRAQFQCLGQQIAGFNRFRLCDYYYQSLSEFQLRADGFLAAPSANDFFNKDDISFCDRNNRPAFMPIRG